MKKQNIPTKQDYIRLLERGVYEICFQKKDKTFRVITGTLIRALIPRNVLEKFINTSKMKNAPGIISVYDIREMRWCSFRIKSIVTFKKLDRL